MRQTKDQIIKMYKDNCKELDKAAERNAAVIEENLNLTEQLAAISDQSDERQDLINLIGKLKSEAYDNNINLSMKIDELETWKITAKNEQRKVSDIQHSLKTINDVWWPTRNIDVNGYQLSISSDDLLPEEETEVFNFLRHLFVLTVR